MEKSCTKFDVHLVLKHARISGRIRSHSVSGRELGLGWYRVGFRSFQDVSEREIQALAPSNVSACLSIP